MKIMIIAAVILVCEAAGVIIAWRNGEKAGMRLGWLEYGLRLLADALSYDRVNRFCREQNMGHLERRAVYKYVLYLLEYMKKLGDEKP